MQSIIHARIVKADLLYLFGIGESQFESFLKAGLPCEPDGRFSLSKVIRWREQRHKKQLEATTTSRLVSQRQLSDLVGVRRQEITAWGPAGLPRRGDRQYDIRESCRWIAQHYHSIAERKFQHRLDVIEKKMRRNIKQLEKFLNQ